MSLSSPFAIFCVQNNTHECMTNREIVGLLELPGAGEASGCPGGLACDRRLGAGRARPQQLRSVTLTSSSLLSSHGCDLLRPSPSLLLSGELHKKKLVPSRLLPSRPSSSLHSSLPARFSPLLSTTTWLLTPKRSRAVPRTRQLPPAAKRAPHSAEQSVGEAPSARIEPPVIITEGGTRAVAAIRQLVAQPPADCAARAQAILVACAAGEGSAARAEVSRPSAPTDCAHH